MGIEGSNPPLDPTLLFYNLDTLRRTQVNTTRDEPQLGREFRVSGDGSLFTSWTISGRAPGTQILEWNDGAIEGWFRSHQTRSLLPAADGRLVFSGSRVLSKRAGEIRSAPDRRGVYVPAVQGRFYLSVVDHGGYGEAAGQAELGLYHAEGERMLMRIGGLEPLFIEDADEESKALTLDKRLHLIPPREDSHRPRPWPEKLHVYRCDPDQWLEESGVDYLFVESDPIQVAVGKEPLRYPIRVRSKRGGVEFHLVEGPSGMTLSPDGELYRDPKGSARDAIPQISVRISDASGQVIVVNSEQRTMGIDH